MNVNPIAWAASTLRLFTRIDYDGVNAAVPVTEIKELPIGFPDMDIALLAKGTGATLAQVPDGTAVNGDKRGSYAVDWQRRRSSASQVASGTYSTIAGGFNNTAAGDNNFVGNGFGNAASLSYVTIGGGLSNTASNNYCFIGGGQSNTASATNAVVCGGQSNIASSARSFVGGGQTNTASTSTHPTVCGGSGNTASGQYSFVGGGQSNSATGTRSTVSGGVTNTASATSSVVCGGQDNLANATFSFISGGNAGTARSIVGNHVFPALNDPFASMLYGKAQSALLLVARETTDATATVLTSNSSAAAATNQVTLPDNSAYSFSGEVIAGVTGAGNSARWTINGAIKRGANAASTAMIGTPTVTMTHFDAGAATWVVAVTANTTLGCITVTVTGAAATTIRWVCKINTTEMTY